MSKIGRLIPIMIGACCLLLDHLLEINLAGEDVQCAFIGAVVAGLASLASGVAGSIAANKRREAAETQMNQRKRTLDAWRDTELGANYLDRADSRAAMRRVMEYNSEAQRAADTNAVKRGMTDEAKVAQAGRLNRNYADVVSQIAGAGARHKDAVQQQHLGATANLDNLRIQNLMDTSGTDNLVSGITGAAASFGTALSGVENTWGKKKLPEKDTSLQRVQTMTKNGDGMPIWNKYSIDL